ncbi:uncharacterized protein LOC8060952 [Sorghum bicolor]|nr:uncharacterized protein LOC8060952 [Sorghum bicolor]KXG25536.1 hypothetical protein SORBI_3007G193900 [Sorghum bicolor]|eukprot:XP_021320361.1 uncharacterized protein LOC8060952 [Sorghum bicolor]
MPEPQAILPLRALPPDAPLPFPVPAPFHPQTPGPGPGPGGTAPATPPNPTPLQPQTPAAPPSSSSTRPPHPWEIAARAWLESFPDGRPPTEPEVDAYIDVHRPELPSLPRSQLHQRLLALRGDQILDADQSAFPYRFQRTDLWKPVYQWLESLELDSLVATQQISDWLTSNPKIMDRLVEKHSKYHLIHYTQRMHLKMLKKKGKLPKTLQLSAARATVRPIAAAVTPEENIVPLQKTIPPVTGIPSVSACRQQSSTAGRFEGGNATLRDKKTSLSKKKEALLKYELLTDLQNQLTAVLLKQCRTVAIKETDSSYVEFSNQETNMSIQGATTANASAPSEAKKVFINEQSVPGGAPESEPGHKRKRNPIIVTPAWCYSEASAEILRNEPNTSSNSDGSRNFNIWKGHANPLVSHRDIKKNILFCLEGRETGVSCSQAASYGGYAGRNCERWTPFLEGWNSPAVQFEGPAVHVVRKSYLSWCPTSCAYTSSAPSAQPHGRQGIRKVLDVKFHPEGLPQLVSSSNEAPNELLLFNLLSGRAIQLRGHNTKIQSIAFAVKGASVVSCASNLLKVWDCITGSCLYTLGGDDQNSVGHTQKINAMAVNKWQSCLVVTSGAKGDGKLLLWNALRGELASDLNSNLRSQDMIYPSVDTMEFYSENHLACGSDCDYGGSAVVQLWDIDSPESYLSFSASDSYITSLKVNPAGNTLITGSGDGTIGLFDIRTCSAISHLSVGSGCEVTSVSFSNCGTYFSGSSTSNNTLVWDTRLVPINQSKDVSRSRDMRFFRPLHCFSHGSQMPTAEYTSQLPGHVDEGDQGVNATQWLHNEPVLVTVSGDGSVGMWDVTLGQPCVRHIVAHTRCANAVAVAPNDEYLCTGGSDQKVVLYHNRSGRTHLNWRLSHPLQGND